MTETTQFSKIREESESETFRNTTLHVDLKINNITHMYFSFSPISFQTHIRINQMFYIRNCTEITLALSFKRNIPPKDDMRVAER